MAGAIITARESFGFPEWPGSPYYASQVWWFPGLAVRTPRTLVRSASRSGALFFEAHPLVRTIAEGLRPGPAAAAEVNPLTFWPRVLVALSVDYFGRAVQPIRAVSPDQDSYFFGQRRLHEQMGLQADRNTSFYLETGCVRSTLHALGEARQVRPTILITHEIRPLPPFKLAVEKVCL